MNVNKLIIASLLCLVFIPSLAAAKSLTCMSANKSFVRCDLPDADMRDIRITKYKIGNCHLDNAWGVDSRGIWVDKGCGAEFEYGPVTRSSSYSPASRTVVVVPGLVVAPLAAAVLYNSYPRYHHHHHHHGHHR